MIFLALFGTGILAGVLGALLGLGGGVFLVPALTLLFGLPMRTAVGTSLVAVIATSAGVAAVAPPGRGGDIRLGMRLQVATTAGAVTGGLVAGLFSDAALNILFAGIAFFTAGYISYKTMRRRPSAGKPEQLYSTDYRPKNYGLGSAISLVAGVISGLLGVGGGFIQVPVMYAIMDIPLGIATATSNFMVGVTAAASVFVYYGRGDVHPLVVIPTAAGVFVGAMLGVYALARLRVSWVRTALIGLLIFLGIQMFIQGITA